MKRRAVLFAAAAGLVAGASVVASGWNGSPAAPEVEFDALSGSKVRLGALRGRVVLVNFWSTTCVTCMTEMARMIETHRRFAPHGFQTIAVAVKSDLPDRVASVAKERSLPFTVALDTTGEAALRFGNVRATPTTFLIDRNGRVLKKYLGQPDWTELHALVQKALAG